MNAEPNVNKITLKQLTVCLIAAICLSTAHLYAQPDLLPQDFFASSWTEALLDAGYLWQANSIFHPFPAAEIASDTPLNTAFGWMLDDLHSYSVLGQYKAPISNDSLRLLTLISAEGHWEGGLNRRYDGIAEVGSVYGKLLYRKHYYAEIYIRATSQTETLEHFSGHARPQGRFGFNVGESDKTVIGFQYYGISLDFGRSREIWGSQSIENLVLAGNSPPYERFMFQFRFKKFTYRSFFGFLETTGPDLNVQRYISGGAIEYRNHTNFVLGISGTSLFSGKNRPIDLGFLNPLSSHLDVDQNDRGNSGDASDNNAIWGIYADWYIRPGIRTSISIAADEIELDKGSGKESGKLNLRNALAYSQRIAWTPLRSPFGLTFVGSWVRIDPFTFKHRTIYSRNVTRNELIGHPIGNDAEMFSFGIRSVLRHRVQILFETAVLNRGEESMVEDPYGVVDDYTVKGFPTGDISRSVYARVNIKAWLWDYFQIQLDGTLDLDNEGVNSSVERVALKLRYSYPVRKVWVNG